MAASQSSTAPFSSVPPVAAHGWEWVAALAVLAVGAIGAWKLPRAGVAEWERHALNVVQAVQSQRMPLSREGVEPEPLLAWLRSESAPTPTKLPGALAQQKTMGARHWERKGRRYSLVAFEIEGAATAALVATPTDGRADRTTTEKPRVRRSGDWTFASWTDAGTECLLLTDAPESEIAELLAAEPAAK